MAKISLMQQALGKQWYQLPAALQAHYQPDINRDVGRLSVEYPWFMRPVIWLLGLFGVLVSRQGNEISTTVQKQMRANRQSWQRLVCFPAGKQVRFNSVWVYDGDNRIIEYVNPLLGLCMLVHVADEKLYYKGKYFVLNLGVCRLHLPEWLFLGYTTIVEQAVDENQFTMDFRLTHPVFGQVYRYSGVFVTQLL